MLTAWESIAEQLSPQKWPSVFTLLQHDDLKLSPSCCGALSDLDIDLTLTTQLTCCSSCAASLGTFLQYACFCPVKAVDLSGVGPFQVSIRCALDRCVLLSLPLFYLAWHDRTCAIHT